MQNKSILITIILVIIVGAGAFFAGTKYQAGKQNTSVRQFGGTQNQRGVNNRIGFRPVNGEIVNSDDKSVTVKLTDGSSKIVLFSDKTTFNKASLATQADLVAGEKIAVFGVENTDGSVTAQSIQLNPLMRETSASGTLK